MPSPKIVDNDKDEISAVVLGKEIRGWSYKDDAERRIKMLAAQEFAEGWFQAQNTDWNYFTKRLYKVLENQHAALHPKSEPDE